MRASLQGPRAGHGAWRGRGLCLPNSKRGQAKARPGRKANRGLLAKLLARWAGCLGVGGLGLGGALLTRLCNKTQAHWGPSGPNARQGRRLSSANAKQIQARRPGPAHAPLFQEPRASCPGVITCKAASARHAALKLKRILANTYTCNIPADRHAQSPDYTQPGPQCLKVGLGRPRRGAIGAAARLPRPLLRIAFCWALASGNLVPFRTTI